MKGKNWLIKSLNPYLKKESGGMLENLDKKISFIAV